MDNQDLNKAENVVNKAQWKINEVADKAKEYIREQRDKNEEPTAEGWLERAKQT